MSEEEVSEEVSEEEVNEVKKVKTSDKVNKFHDKSDQWPCGQAAHPVA